VKKISLILKYAQSLFFSALILSSFICWTAEENSEWIRDQIYEDFAPFSNGIYEENLNRTMKSDLKLGSWESIIRVKIINSVVYQFDQSGKLVNIPAISYHLKKIFEKQDLPDLDFIYFNGTGTELVDRSGNPALGPVLAGNKTDACTNLILFHDRVTAVYPQPYSWQVAINDVEEAAKNHPWEKKLPLLIWNGAITDIKMDDWKKIQKWSDYSKRGQLYLLSLKHPGLMSVGITHFLEIDGKKIHNKKTHLSPSLSINDQMAYKYQIVLDGVTCTNPGYAWRLLSDCVCLKLDSPNRQWFYRALQPNVHYILIKDDFSNLVDTLEYLKNNDDAAYEIAMNGRKWAKENLVDEAVLLDYCSQVLLTYASLQAFTPELSSQEKRVLFPDPEYSKLKKVLSFNGHSFFHKDNAEALTFLIKKYHCKTVVELGSWLGASTRHIANCLPEGGLVFAIDHWKGSEEHHKSSRSDVQKFLPNLYKQFLSNCIHANLTNKIIPRRMTTLEAAKELTLKADLIYVDASHDEKSVYDDLVAWYPHLKQDGILCGDDWTWNRINAAIPPIQAAVKRFAKEHNLYIEMYGPLFWMLKKDPRPVFQ